MNALSAELQRLFGHPGQPLPDPLPEAGVELALAGPDGRAWAMVVGIAPAAGWAPVAALCEGLVGLDLPLPAVSLAGAAGFCVWLSLADPVPLARAADFLAALRRRFLAELPDGLVTLLPTRDGTLPVRLPPALLDAAGRWSAFIDPNMGGMFADETWLDMAPAPERQAELLAGFRAIGAADFERALKLLDPPGAVVPAPGGPVAGMVMAPPAVTGAAPHIGLAVGSGFVDPKSFLLAVMNDPAASADHRIEAAKALLPYFEG